MSRQVNETRLVENDAANAGTFQAGYFSFESSEVDPQFADAVVDVKVTPKMIGDDGVVVKRSQ